jgi:hypothetical protein
VTREETHASFAVLHFGGHDVRCAVGALTDLDSYREMRDELMALFERRSVSDVVRAIDLRFGRRFPGREYGLSDLFLDERRKIAKVLVDDVLNRRKDQMFRLFEENRPLIRFLIEGDIPVPAPLRAAADYTLSARYITLANEARFGSNRWDQVISELKRLHEEAKQLGVTLDDAQVKAIFEGRLLDETMSLVVSPRRDTARAILAYLDLAASLGLDPGLWEAQNLFWSLALDGPRGPDADVPLLLKLGERLGFDSNGLRMLLGSKRDEGDPRQGDPRQAGRPTTRRTA